MQIRLITTLLIGAALLWLGGRLARRQSRSETFESSLALCAVAHGLALIPADWRSWLAGGDAGADIGAFARVAGITGLMFLAGLRFEAEELWKTRRVVDFAPAAGALLFTSIATLLAMIDSDDRGAVIADDRSPKGAKKSGVFTRGQTVIPATIIAVSLAALGPAALAQSSEEDPAKRAMERIEAAVGERAVAADRALAASKLVNESAEARKRGDPQQAIESLEKAEKIVAEDGSFERSALIDQLLRLVAKEHA